MGEDGQVSGGLGGGGFDEDDPGRWRMMQAPRRHGMDLGPGMEEAIRRMEAGEDPDKIQEG